MVWEYTAAYFHLHTVAPLLFILDQVGLFVLFGLYIPF